MIGLHPTRLSDEFPETTVRDGFFLRTDFSHGDTDGILCLVGSQKYVDVVNRNPNVVCAVTLPHLVPLLRSDLGIASDVNAQFAFYTVHNRMSKQGRLPLSVQASIHPSAKIHSSAQIEVGCYIGKDVVIEPNAVVKAGTHLSEGVYIGAGALIGVEGHFYKRYAGRLLRIEHAGGVKVGERTEILAGSIVQRALHADFTEIGCDSVIAPGVHIAHGVKIGSRTTLAGSSQVAGYTKIGDDVWIGPSSVIGNLLSVGDRARVEMGAIVARSLAEGDRVSGFYAASHTRMLRAQAKVLAK